MTLRHIRNFSCGIYQRGLLFSVCFSADMTSSRTAEPWTLLRRFFRQNAQGPACQKAGGQGVSMNASSIVFLKQGF